MAHLPSNFPAIWLQPREASSPPPPPAVPADGRLGFVSRALAHAPAAADAPLERSPAPAVSTAASVVPLAVARATQAAEPKPLDGNCAVALDLATRLGAAGPEGVAALRSALQRAARTPGGAGDADATAAVRRAMYEFVMSVPRLVDVLRTPLGDEIPELFAAMGTTTADGFCRVRQRLVNATDLLRNSARPARPCWMVLLRPTVDLDHGAAPTARTSIAAAVALGDATCAYLPPSIVAAPLLERQRAVVTAVCRAVAARPWGLRDCLIPCGACPIRTRLYLRYVDGVRHLATAAIDAVADTERRTAERDAAWALTALSSCARWTRREFVEFVAACRGLRAHESPRDVRHAGPWLLARAMLARDLDAVEVATLVRAGVLAHEPDAAREREALMRAAAFCVTTRTLAGARMLAGDVTFAAAALATAPDGANGVLQPPVDLIARSPSGVSELSSFELSGWCEWSCGAVPELAARLGGALEGALEAAEADAAGRAVLEAARRLLLVDKCMLTPEWRVALASVEPLVEVAMQRVFGALPPDVDPLRLRRRVLDAVRLVDTRRPVVVVARNGDVAVARALAPEGSPIDAALAFEAVVRHHVCEGGETDAATAALLARVRHPAATRSRVGLAVYAVYLS